MAFWSKFLEWFVKDDEDPYLVFLEEDQKGACESSDEYESTTWVRQTGSETALVPITGA